MGTGYATIVKGEEDEKRGIKVFTETGRTVSDDRKGIDRDQTEVILPALPKASNCRKM